MASVILLAAFNAWFHGLTGVHMWVYTLTDWLGLVPVFGNGADGPSPVSLVGLASSSPWVKPVFVAVIGMTVLCGLAEVVASRLERRSLNRALLIAGCALSVACVAAFIVARQPYAGILCFALLVVKCLVVYRRDARPMRP